MFFCELSEVGCHSQGCEGYTLHSAVQSMVLPASHAPPPMLISVDDLINKMQNVMISEVPLFLCYAKSVLLAGPVCH